jgi:hypothetical protein
VRLTARLIEFYTAQNYFSISERGGRMKKKVKENVCFSAAKLILSDCSPDIYRKINDEWI